MTRRAVVAALAAAGAGAAAEPAWMGVEEASRALAAKRMSSVELTKACLARIETLNPKLNAFITVMTQQALDEAAARDRERSAGRVRGPLHGVPVAVKDLLDTAGVKTTAGSQHWADRVPAEDAEVVRRLRGAGAVILGKLNMDEFAYNFTSETSYFGVCRNPWDVTRTPGGSSGGSAVAVAAGMCGATLGSDTGGSIRLPAALCGITGFKPTYGRVSAKGCAPLAWSLDHVGPMCRSAADAALVFNAMTDAPVRLDRRGGKGLRLGVPRALFFEGLDGEVAQGVERAIGELGQGTAGVRDVTLTRVPDSDVLRGFPEPYVTIIGAEAYAFHEPMLKANPDQYHQGTRRSIEGGAGVTTAQYIRARQMTDEARVTCRQWFRDVDLLITPSTVGPAFELGSRADLVYLRNAAHWNLYGLPAVSIPCGFTKSGLPVGVQITGAPGRDDLVLSLAAAYQAATDWHRKRPLRS